MTAPGEKRPPRGWRSGLTREEFEALLAALDPDREAAGEKYETIRRKLIRLFEWRGCDSPEDLADVTISRVAKRIVEGVDVCSSGYFYGVAHLVYKEEWRRVAREQRALERGDWPPCQPEEEPEEDQRLACLNRCLGQLPPGEKNLLLRYYQGDDKIRNRKDLCRERNISINALRIQVHRVRRKLESCVRDCLDR
jgi:DNA-directed RNA polymerase specialized sigma24 family protein